MSIRPQIRVEMQAGNAVMTLDGSWIARRARLAEAAVAGALAALGSPRRVTMDLQGVDRIDTAGAWLVERTRRDLAEGGASVELRAAKDKQRILIEEVQAHYAESPPARPPERFVDLLADLGKGVTGASEDLVSGTSYLGLFASTVIRAFTHPTRLRYTSIVHHLEMIGLRSVPIIALISFLVGGIVAQQGIFQLNTFGAPTLVVDLVGILTLRELALLLTSIMIAGRSGSSITAELGSMKMREEIDALHVIGLDPMEVLILPRVIALLIAMPMLTFISSMAALFGAGVVALIYGGISPEVFLFRLQNAVGIHTFLVGMIKAPFMALVIGLIATMEGMGVEGSAESLGRQTTSSVVKSIFMVIVVDGIFAMFFAGINY
ncbi:phospholipid/cholesterol/gamma-HCH transport system permease protein [Rhizobiales bacterium GAS191]|nr:phospholipid/cholesterol/gamma-HCH transport system permease protein [Rhizobiales bacterium GAS113]SEB78800.1 phospholipid/cholesterol/gamma-HCH transport system permease protein [Rhizobiales bacterium GAS188]SED48747.1 phospholipid/cholesterol/gamma-HCH transport system permease protein [Rhizobiales bacterium GAS191]